MPRGFGLRVFSKFLFYLSFLPSLLLALRLNVPTRSSDGRTIYANWVEDAGDPETIYLQLCIGAIISPFRIAAQVSELHTSVHEISPVFTSESMPSTGCRLYAFEDTKSTDPIAQSDIFKTLEVAPSPVSSIPSNSSTAPTPTIGRTLNNSSSALVDTTTPSLRPSSLLPEGASNGPSASITLLDPGAPGLSPGITSTRSSFGQGTPSVFTSSRVTSLIPTTSATVMGGEPESARHTPSRAALIGGILGGVALLAALIIFFVLHLRRKRHRSSFTTTIPPRQHIISDDHDNTFRGAQATISRVRGAAEAARNGMDRMVSRILPPFRRQPAHSPFVNPLVHGENHLRPESKRERLKRVHREMEDNRRRREMLQSDLDSRSNMDMVSNGSEVGLDHEVEQRLRQQIEVMSRRIEELEAERQEVIEAPPPDYYSSVLGG